MSFTAIFWTDTPFFFYFFRRKKEEKWESRHKVYSERMHLPLSHRIFVILARCFFWWHCCRIVGKYRGALLKRMAPTRPRRKKHLWLNFLQYFYCLNCLHHAEHKKFNRSPAPCVGGKENGKMKRRLKHINLCWSHLSQRSHSRIQGSLFNQKLISASHRPLTQVSPFTFEFLTNPPTTPPEDHYFTLSDK